MRAKLFSVGCLVLLLLVFGTACSNYEQQNAMLRQLLPTRQGFRWVYSGFAEYGHSMELASAPVTENGKTAYSITGKVDDPSGGEAPGPLDFSLTYQIAGGKLSRSLSPNSRLLDKRFPTLELIRTPLVKGTSWKQTVQDDASKSVTLNCGIVEVTNQNNINTYRVRYDDLANNYWEERVIQDGLGVVAVELPYEGSAIGYMLYADASGYPEQLQLNAFLPPLGEELRFVGMAEYAHTGSVQLVSQTSEAAVAEFTGEFQDGSGIPGTFRVQYLLDYTAGTVTEKVLSNSRSGKAEVNSLLHDPIILKLPLQAGASWDQTVNIDGSPHPLHATIRESTLQYNGQPQDRLVVRVRYEVSGVKGYFRDNYLEERVFQVGRGMIGFSKLMKGDIGLSGKDIENEQLVEEALRQHMFGYGLNMPVK